jgi:hypothetical protein
MGVENVIGRRIGHQQKHLGCGDRHLDMPERALAAGDIGRGVGGDQIGRLLPGDRRGAFRENTAVRGVEKIVLQRLKLRSGGFFLGHRAVDHLNDDGRIGDPRIGEDPVIVLGFSERPVRRKLAGKPGHILIGPELKLLRDRRRRCGSEHPYRQHKAGHHLYR